jgi:hypothetical protein
MKRALRIHPDSRRRSVRRIDVTVHRPQPTRLGLRFVLSGNIGKIVWPAPTPSKRADGLWQHSCFEAFLCRPGDEAYCEFNVSPSTQWAAYSFERYRTGVHNFDIEAPVITVEQDAESFVLDAELSLPETFAVPMRLALCAVIEDLDGALSYWALNHPVGKPDFHHRDGFALELGAS